ncbi:MAG: hypothetical protein JXB42_11400 [Deltaproteobacteria bacterium]|nr:hypothetical protein [Deltaproteobacteria bacterium]
MNLIERIPPQALDVERTILGSMLVDKACCSVAFALLNEDSFYMPINSKIFSVMKQLFIKNNPIDIVSVSKALEDKGMFGEDFDSSYIAEISENIAVFQNIEYYAKILIEKQLRRKIIELSTQAVNSCYCEEDLPAENISSKIISELLSAGNDKKGVARRIGELLPDEFDRLEKICSGKQTAFITTGIRSIDENVYIGQHDYIIIGARPSNGKSSLAGCIARHLGKQGRVVLKITLDSTSENEVSRDLFSEAKINLHDFNRGFTSKEKMKSLSKASSNIFDIPVFIDDPAKITPSQIYAKCLSLKHREGKIDLVIIDYLQQADPEIRSVKKNERVSDLSRSLKALPKMIGCPVIALSQLTRYECENKNPPRLELLKESGDLEADINIAILLYVPGRYDLNVDQNLIQCIIAKNKNGYTGTLNLNFFREYFLITDREERSGNDEYKNSSSWQNR